MALATASNWVWNFLLSFFTPFITSSIDYRYGYVFAGCCFAGAVIVYFFLCESQGRSLEEIDTMYIFGVKPWHSKHWSPPEGDELPNLDGTYLTPGGRGIKKKEEARVPEQAMVENVPQSEMLIERIDQLMHTVEQLLMLSRAGQALAGGHYQQLQWQ